MKYLVNQGPMYSSLEYWNGKASILFTNTDSGLVVIFTNSKGRFSYVIRHPVIKKFWHYKVAEVQKRVILINSKLKPRLLKLRK